MSLTLQTKAELRHVLTGLEALNISLSVVFLCWIQPCSTVLLKMMFSMRLMRYPKIHHHTHKSCWALSSP
jgi:hypothetical protein